VQRGELGEPVREQRGRHHDDGQHGVPAGDLPVLGAVDRGTGEHHGRDQQAVPDVRHVLVGEQQGDRQGEQQDRAGQHRPAAAGGQRGQAQRQHRRHQEGQRRAGQPARRQRGGGHPGHREGDRRPRARPVQPQGEEGGHDQVERHLEAERPDHRREQRRAQQLRQHREVGDRAGDGRRRGQCHQQANHQIERVEPGQPAEPEPAQVAVPFQRGRDDVAADQEEQHHPGRTGVQPLGRHVPRAAQQVVAQVRVDDEQGRDGPQRVEPRHPSLRHPERVPAIMRR